MSGDRFALAASCSEAPPRSVCGGSFDFTEEPAAEYPLPLILWWLRLARILKRIVGVGPYNTIRISHSCPIWNEREPLAAALTFMSFEISCPPVQAGGLGGGFWSTSAMMKRHMPSLLMPLLIAAALSLSVHAHAQSRVALVIGNNAYKKVPNLANPAHDAQDVSESLKRLGFTVNTVTDADFDGFRRALRDFGRMAPNAAMAVFYFAGHGVEINGTNWLLPTDAELKR